MSSPEATDITDPKIQYGRELLSTGQFLSGNIQVKLFANLLPELESMTDKCVWEKNIAHVLGLQSLVPYSGSFPSCAIRKALGVPGLGDKEYPQQCVAFLCIQRVPLGIATFGLAMTKGGAVPTYEWMTRENAQTTVAQEGNKQCI